jgi:hypothetical protein
MIVCPSKYGEADIVLPVCVAKGNLSRDTVTAILIQVKTSDCFQCSIINPCFDEMDPFFGVFSEGQSPRPIIRVIFALGSHEAGFAAHWHVTRSRSTVARTARTTQKMITVIVKATLLHSIFGAQDCRRTRSRI